MKDKVVKRVRSAKERSNKEKELVHAWKHQGPSVENVERKMARSKVDPDSKG